MKSAFKAAGLLFALSLASSVSAAVVQTFGSGSAVTSIEASADFESLNSLTDNPYVENGLYFSRTDLTNNNNGCGFTGCKPSSFSYFPGNYMYGSGTGGYFSIATAPGQAFTGLEFIAGHGYSDRMAAAFGWETFLNGAQTGAGTGVASVGTVVGFADASGFDTLRWTSTIDGAPSATSNNSPAFDSVRAQFSASADVPEPAEIAIFGLGLVGLIAARKRKA